MAYENITIDDEGSVAILTLNQPDRLNAMSEDMQHELIDAATAIADSDARAVVIRGAGRAFCAGVNVAAFEELANGSDDDRYQAFKLGGDMAIAIETIPQPTVAALHGFVIGGGVVLAAACDLRVAAENTIFAIPEIDLGITLGWNGIDRLVREIGPALTKELVMTGRRFTAQEALAARFINGIAESEDVEDVALALATTIAAKSHASIRSTKEHIAEILVGDHSRDDALTAATSMNDPESRDASARYLSEMARET